MGGEPPKAPYGFVQYCAAFQKLPRWLALLCRAIFRSPRTLPIIRLSTPRCARGLWGARCYFEHEAVVREYDRLSPLNCLRLVRRTAISQGEGVWRSSRHNGSTWM